MKVISFRKLYSSDVGSCLIVKIHAPGHAMPNSTAHLECNFELENEKQLDTVKMLKDGQTFLLFAPNEIDQLYSVPGMNANVSAM